MQQQGSTAPDTRGLKALGFHLQLPGSIRRAIIKSRAVAEGLRKHPGFLVVDEKTYEASATALANAY
jgi:hypothetical protein